MLPNPPVAMFATVAPIGEPFRRYVAPVAPMVVDTAVASVTHAAHTIAAPMVVPTAAASVTHAAPTIAAASVVAHPLTADPQPRPKTKARAKAKRGYTNHRQWPNLQLAGQSVQTAVTQVIVFRHWDVLFTLYFHNFNFAYLISCLCLFLRVLFAYV